MREKVTSMYVWGFSVYVLLVIWVPQHCGTTFSSVSPTSATEKPIFSMNWPSIPVQAMHAQHWPTHYTRQLSLSLSHFPPLSASLSLIQHFTHPSLPPLCLAYSHPPVFCSACPLHHSVHPALPPTWLFLPCLARNHPAEVVNGMAVSASLSFRVCLFRGRGGGGRGSGLRMWARCLRTLIPPSLTGSWQCQGP